MSKKIPFYKFHGAGNDFILIDNRQGFLSPDDEELIARLCDRHKGVGADGLMLIEETADADFQVHYLNSDGRPAAMCGNGARCAVFLAHQLGLAKQQCRFLVNENLYVAEVLANRTVRLQMQVPAFLAEPDDLKELETKHFHSFLWLDTGVPHLVVTSAIPLEQVDVVEKGRYFRLHPRFRPEGVNVNFVQPGQPGELAVRVYERGVESETLACGTGAVACGIYASRVWGWSSPVSVKSPGGVLTVEFDDSFEQVFLTGAVSRVFEGWFNPEDF